MSSRPTRFRVDPERSWVLVEGESSVHPIQRRRPGSREPSRSRSPVIARS